MQGTQAHRQCSAPDAARAEGAVGGGSRSCRRAQTAGHAAAWGQQTSHKLTVSNPTRSVELEPATTLYRRPQALLLTQSSSSEPKAGPPEGQGRRSEGSAFQASRGLWHPACCQGALGVCSAPSSPQSAARQSLHPWVSRHQLHCQLGTKPQNDTHKTRQGAPPGSNLSSEASQKVTRASRHTWHEQ